MQTKLLELCNKASKLQNLELVALMKDIIPEYISNNSKFGVLDNVITSYSIHYTKLYEIFIRILVPNL